MNPQDVNLLQLPVLTVEESGYWRIEVTEPDLHVVQSAAEGGELFLLRVINIPRGDYLSSGNSPIKPSR